MATVTAYLQGGPCDGRTRKLTQAETKSGSLTCGGDLYLFDGGKLRPNGDTIFKDAGKAPPPGPIGTSLAAPRAHKGWADMRRSVNHGWPAALRASDHQIRAALRSLGRAHKVKL
jgi:hypothetical protein